MTGEEWEALRQRIGNGDKPPVESYPFQGVNLSVWKYGYNERRFGDRLFKVACSRSLDAKYLGQASPVSGRPLAELARSGGDLLASPCGNCGALMSRCRCDFRAGE